MRHIVFFLSLLFWPFLASGEISLNTWQQGALGQNLSYFQEHDAQLDWQQAEHHFQTYDTYRYSGQSLSLGIGVAPAWLHATFNNDSSATLRFRLSVETAWLDYIDTYLVKDGRLVEHIAGGDGYPFEERPMPYRFYAFEAEFPPGVTEVYIRVQTKGPMALPVYLARSDRAQVRDISSGYEYGVLYGIMFALALYNLILYFNIRKSEYGLYSLYLLGFVANSLSYTGKIHVIFTPDFGPYFQDWADTFLMITYSVFGLHFARKVLNTKAYAPKLDKITWLVAAVIPAGMLVGALFNSLMLSMALSFLLNTSFAALFIILGFKAFKAKVPSAKLFIISSVSAAICIGISTGAVAGLFPLNDFTFKLIEVGMAFEAILLAALLGQRFRTVQQQKAVAEHVARTDELTQLLNRRGFRETSEALTRNAIKEKQDISVLLIDIDKFKQINDKYGHIAGDLVLTNMGHCISQTIRASDIAARWGGEEFIVCLPNTSQAQAEIQAENLRTALEQLRTIQGGRELRSTVSIGVSGSTNLQFNGEPFKISDIEPIINQADIAMYQAKLSGGNQLCSQYMMASSVS